MLKLTNAEIGFESGSETGWPPSILGYIGNG